MGTIKKLYQDQLVGGSGGAGQEVYPVTSALGVYDTDNNQLQGVLDKLTTNLELFTCGTSAATAAKAVSASKFVLMEGGSVKIKFTYANSAASPTLAIGTTAAKPIIYNGAEASASNSWEAGEVVEFYYDGTNWVGRTTTPATKEQLNQLGQELYEKINVLETPQYTSGFFYNGTNRGSGVNWQCAIIPIDGVTHLLVKTNMYGDSANCCITEASDNVLASWKQADLVNNLIDVDLSQYPGASKLYFSVYQFGGFVFDDAFVYGTKPVASKENIVKIEEEISDINTKIFDINAEISGVTPIDSGELVAGLVTVRSAPDFVSGGTYRTTDFLPVNAGEKITAKCAIGSSGYAITCYSSNTQSSYVAGTGVVGVDGSTLNDYEITIPNGVNYIRVTSESAIEGFDGTIHIERLGDDGIIPRIEEIEDELSGQTIIELNVPVLVNKKGQTQNSGGSTGYWASDFIFVTEGKQYSVALAGGPGCMCISGYSSNEQSAFVNSEISILGDDTLQTYKFVVPIGVHYIRLCNERYTNPVDSVTLNMLPDSTRIKVIENSLDRFGKTLLDYPRTSPRLPMIMFQMDMSDSAYTTKIRDYENVLAANGIKHSTYNILPEYLTNDAYHQFEYWNEILYSHGNEFALHTGPSHNIFSSGSSATIEQIEAAMVDYFDKLLAKGFKTTGFIPLGASLKSTFKPVVRKYSSWMLSGDGNDCNIWDSDRADFICSLANDPYTIKRVAIESMAEDWTAEKDAEYAQNAKDLVDAVIANGGYLIFYGHSYNESTEAYTVRPNVLTPLAEYVKTKLDAHQCIVGNTANLLEWYYTSRVDD